jgi:two-component system sensor histidine kinase YesM
MIHKIKNYLMNTTIKQKLTLLLFIFVLYPVIVVSFFGYFKYAGDIRNEILNSLDMSIEQVNDLTVERFKQMRHYAMMIPYDGTLNDLYIKKKNGRIKQYDLSRDLTAYLYSKFYSKQEIKAVSFFFTDSSELVYMVQSDNSYNRYINQVHPVIRQVSENMDNQFGYYLSDDGEFYAIRKMVDRYSYKQYGVITIKLEKEYMLKYFRNSFQDGSGLILTYEGNSIFEDGSIPEDDRGFIMRQISGEPPGISEQIRYRSKSYEIIASRIDLENISLKYGVIMSTEKIMGKYYEALRLLVLITIIVTISMVISAILIYKAVWSPIRELLKLMKLLEKGNLGVQYKVSKNDEFKFIFQSFNNMSQEIKYLFDVAYKEKLERKEAQLLALQAQINPHFLYNTLEIINWKARIAGEHEISEMIEALGTLLDAGMNKGGQKVSKIRDELKLVDAYVYIMKKRYGKNLEFVLNVDDSLLDAEIPRLLIQPILENAFVHGIEPRGGGLVKLSAEVIKGRLTVTVEDNGEGIQDEDLGEYEKLFSGEPSKIGSSTGIGVKNVHNRIQIIYGKEYGLCLKKRVEGGTVSVLTIPCTA